jgi:aryl-alcohol dehydrogenase-like predicted oxidoreductase
MIPKTPLVYLHRSDRKVPLEEMLEALDKA